jgi:nitroreductase
MMNKADFIPFSTFKHLSEADMIEQSAAFYQEIKRRKTIRDYSNRAVPTSVIENCLLAAGTAPNGANLQPWHFVVITDKDVKTKIRREAEKEELDFYKGGKAPKEWLDALAHLGTDEHKPFLEEAPCLIAIFAKSYDQLPDGTKRKHYYVSESVGIATGFLINALHSSGLATLTHTPSPMGFLNTILDRPKNERPFLLLVVGYPKENAMVPDIKKKPLTEIATFI